MLRILAMPASFSRNLLIGRQLLGSASVLALLAIGAASPSAVAQTVWQGPDLGDWQDGANWSTTTEPGSGEDVQLTVDGASQTVDYNPSGAFTYNTLQIDGTSGGSMYLRHTTSSETLATVGNLTVGVLGTGELSLQGTTATTVGDDLVLGQTLGSSGTLEINTYAAGIDNATLSIGRDLIVGQGGVGHVEHGITDTSNPGITVNGGIIVGQLFGSQGSYHLYNNTGGAAAATFVDDLIVGDNGTGSFVNDNTSHAVVGDLLIGNQVNGKGTYAVINGGTTTVTGATVVGVAGQGRFLNENSTHETDTLVIGRDAGSTGHYKLDNGTLTVAGDTRVGGEGTGTFTHLSGTHTTNGALLLGGDLGNGTYNLSGGTLNVNSATIGDGFDAVGTFNHSAGTFNVTGELSLGHTGSSNNAEGYYNLSGTGILNADSMRVSVFGYGEVNQSGGTANITNTLLIGSAEAFGGTPPREGHYNLSDGTLNTGTTIVGGGENGFLVGPGPLGFFNQTGGAHNTTDLIVGQGGTQFGGQGQYDIGTGNLNVAHDMRVGEAGLGAGSTGVVNQTGGGVTIGTLAQPGGSLFLGSGNGTGTYNISDGTLDVTQGNDPHIYVSEGGTGSFNQTGGDVDAGFVHVGTLGAGTGTYTMSGGTLDAGTLLIGSAGATGAFTMAPNPGVDPDPQVTAGGLFISGDGTNLGSGLFDMQAGSLTVTFDAIVGDISSGAQFKQSGGTHMVGNAVTLGDLILGNASGVTGTYDLSGASSALNVFDTIVLGNVASSTGIFNQDDGAVTAMSMLVGASGAGTYTQNGGSVDLAGGLGLLISSTATGDGAYELKSGTLTTNATNVGYANAGTFTQSGGTHNAGALNLGDNGGKGEYSLTNGDLITTVTRLDGVDLAHEGLFQQTGGTHTTNNLEIAVGNAEFGRYELGGTGILDVSATLYVGFGGTGVFNQTGGTATSNTTIVGLGVLSNGTYNQSDGTHNAGQLTVGQLAGAIGVYNMTGGTLNDSAVIGDAGIGTFNLSNGNHNVVGDLTLGNQSTGDGTYNLSATGALDVTGNVIVGKDGAGHYNQSGGTATVAGQVTVKSGTGTGEANLSGGTLQAATLVNNDTVALSGTALTANVTNTGTFGYTGGSLTGNVNNSGNFNISGAGTRTVDGSFSNQAGGTVKVTDTTAVYTGLFTNAGSYQSDPAHNTFLSGLTVDPTGTVTGGLGDVFEIHGNFLNHSTQNTLWDTDAASLDLFFDGAGSNAYQLALAGIDLGQSDTGLTNNFSFFDVFVEIDIDDTLLITDGNGGNNAAFYVHEFLIDLADLAFITSAFNIYYDATLAANAYLGCQAHAFGAGGGQLLAYNPNVCGPVVDADEPNSLPLYAAALMFLFGMPVVRRVRRSARQKA
jgi:hypothetical protein